MMITVLYLPAIVCVMYQSVKFYGRKKWFTSIMNDPVYFLLPILTCMSFYGEPTTNSKETETAESNQEKESPNLNTGQVDSGL